MKLKLKGKILLAFMIIVICAVIVAAVGLNRMRIIDKEYSVMIENYGFSQGDLGRAIIALTQANAHTHDAVTYEDEEDIKEAKESMKKELATYSEEMEVVEGSFSDGVGKEEYESAVKLADEYLKAQEEFIAFAEKLDTTVPYDYAKLEKKMVEELDPAYKAAYKALNELLVLKKNEGDKKSTALSKGNTSTYTAALIICMFILAGAITISFTMANAIAGGINKCAKRIHDLVNGDLKSDVPVIKGHDELAELSVSVTTLVKNLKLIIEDEKYVLGKMAAGDMTVHTRCDDSFVGDFEELILSIRRIREGLTDMLTEIDEAAEQVGVGSEQVASGAQELAQGATEQASAVEELNATIDTIAKEIKANAAQAVDMSKLAVTTEAEIEEGNRQMNEMTVAMADISATSNKIAKIIKTIDDIAFQTNILALNAAVEAARAGAAGKGFAVVADEVRNLAGKSAEAAKNTTELIESSIKAVANGTEIADRTAETLNNVVVSAQKTAAIVNQMAISSEEQAKSIEEVSKGIEQISAVVQTNSATSEESAAASEELSCQSTKMRELIGQFVIDKKNRVVKPVQTKKPVAKKKPSSDIKVEYKAPKLEDVNEISLDDFDMDMGMGGKY